MATQIDPRIEEGRKFCRTAIELRGRVHSLQKEIEQLERDMFSHYDKDFSADDAASLKAHEAKQFKAAKSGLTKARNVLDDVTAGWESYDHPV